MTDAPQPPTTEPADDETAEPPSTGSQASAAESTRDAAGAASEALPPKGQQAASIVLRGRAVAPGLAIGVARRKDYELSRVDMQRVPRDRIEHELNRFHQALSDSKDQLETLKERLRGKVPADHARILDTHVSYLRDSVFLSDVENLILGEQMSLEGAIAKVIQDFDRIFRLVESDLLRERAVDLRDVGIRVLRNLERAEVAPVEDDYKKAETILVARELSIVDMFNLAGNEVHGIVTEAGSLTSHAAILARSMRIPTLTAVDGLLSQVEDGDLLIVDAAEGVVRVRPDDVVCDQFLATRAAREDAALTPEWARSPLRTADGEPVTVTATCGNLPEVESALGYGMPGIGLYRTELLYLVDREPPTIETLVAHFQAILDRAEGKSVTFRLLDIDSGLQVSYLHADREQNPGLGQVGVRTLLANESVLRRQLVAILRATADGGARIALPKVIDCGELRRVKEILFEERFALRKQGLEVEAPAQVGVVVETPAACLGIEDLAREADFLAIGLDSLQQYLLAADRDNVALSRHFERLHPYVVQALERVTKVCDDAGKPLSVFGVTAVSPENVPFLLGVGLRHFSTAPVALEGFMAAVRATRLQDARRATELALEAACPSELDPIMRGYGHGLS
ncbi:MAG: phosphoenolpyruvate--protein phosphotransferase [bacterium]|nr:phosphoenolpyruvate--protein phosphotransferase [bacterium]